MKKSAGELRKTAREGLKGNWLAAILAWILAMILGAGGLNFVFNFSASEDGASVGVNVGTSESQTIANPQEVIDEIKTTAEQISTEGWIAIIGVLSFTVILLLTIGFIRYIIGSATLIGYNKFNIDIIDGKGAEIGTMFSGFKIFFKAFGLRLFQDLFIFLWSLLLWIPGIIARYRYAMAPYIMSENHEMGIREAVNLSKKMMKGYKWRLFCLNLSFIGWLLLSVMTCGILFFRTLPYIHAANAAFYRMVSENYAAEQN